MMGDSTQSLSERGELQSGNRAGVRIIAFDVGTVRVGVALSDPTGTIASPLQVMTRTEDAAADARALADLARQYEAEGIVVGMPITLRGQREIAAQQMEQFIALLREATEIPIIECDERMTTAIAERAMIAGDVRRMERRGRIDGVAAAVLLQGYLDAGRGGLDGPTER